MLFNQAAKVRFSAIAASSNQEVGEHFGLRRECFVIGNGYHNDFQQKTLKQSPPEALLDRLEPAVRFVASDAPIAVAFCAAWAQQNRATIVLLSGAGAETPTLEKLDQPNPLYELQRIYLGPMSKPEADSLVTGLGGRMGLIFDEEALDRIYELVGGHPLLIRKLGTAVHEVFPNRAERKIINKRDVDTAYSKRKRDLFNQVSWFLEHLSKVAPDEERLLRDIACGGAQAYAELWGDSDFRDNYAYHLERYGLVKFVNDLPELTLSLIKEALQKPIASEYVEQKRQLKDIVEAIEKSVRIRLRVDIERNCTPTEAVHRVVNAVPSDAKNRALSREELLDLGALAGVGAVLDSLNWGDYEILLDKFYDDMDWTGEIIEKQQRLAMLKETFTDAHLVRHNNDHNLKEMITQKGYDKVYARFANVREMLSS